MNDTLPNSCLAPTSSNASPISTVPELFTASDAGDATGCSATTIKRVHQELHLPVITTKSGIHLYTAEMVRRIEEELERRANEKLRREGQHGG